jgi:hypothetical protein
MQYFALTNDRLVVKISKTLYANKKFSGEGTAQHTPASLTHPQPSSLVALRHRSPLQHHKSTAPHISHDNAQIPTSTTITTTTTTKTNTPNLN